MPRCERVAGHATRQSLFRFGYTEATATDIRLLKSLLTVTKAVNQNRWLKPSGLAADVELEVDLRLRRLGSG